MFINLNDPSDNNIVCLLFAIEIIILNRRAGGCYVKNGVLTPYVGHFISDNTPT